MARVDELYHRLCLGIIDQGYWYDDKSRGVRCKQLSSLTIDFEIENEIPLITTKKMYTQGVVGELLWFLRGDPHVSTLVQQDINIWNKDAYTFYKKMYKSYPLGKPELSYEDWLEKQRTSKPTHSGDVGRNYGVQWRSWQIKGVNDDNAGANVDQIGNLIQGLKDNPMSRRHVVTAWNPAELEETALPPCHWAFEIIPRPLYVFEKEFYPDTDYAFTLKWHQRSVDTFLGLPFNILSYTLMAKIIEQLTGMKAIGLIGDLSNVHLYEPHIDKVREQLKNNPSKYKAATFTFSDRALERFKHFRDGQATLDEILNELDIKDFIFNNYEHYPAIKSPMIAPNSQNNKNS